MKLIITAAAISAVLVLLSALCGCSGSKPEADPPKPFIIENILDLSGLIGKTAEEAGIPTGNIEMMSGKYYRTDIKGSLLGYDVYGKLYFVGSDSAEPVVGYCELYPVSDSEGIDDAAVSVFGAADEDYTTPYTAVNGGSLHVRVYSSDKLEVALISSDKSGTRI